MLKEMTFDEFQTLAAQKLFIPVWRQIPGDMLTPSFIFQALVGKQKKGFLLDSADHGDEVGRYSFIGFDPVAHFEAYNDEITYTENSQTQYYKEFPLDVLRTILNKNKSVEVSHLPNFTGGAVGFFSYDSIRLFEKIPARHLPVNDIPDIFFNFYETTIAYDHHNATVTLVYLVRPGDNLKEQYDHALSQIDQDVTLLNTFRGNLQIPPCHEVSETEEDMNDDEFKKIVIKAKDYIHNGDIVQVVLSRRFTRKTCAEPFSIYRALKISSPAPYLFFIQEPEYQIIGASPERLVELKQGILKSNPLAGTYPKPSKKDEKEVEEKLLNDVKECAEHMMLVDLARNDIGKISNISSVEVKKLKSILRLSHVIHISSEIQGHIREGLDALDAIMATLPAGTLSGAPKIRAMEIIDELEGSRRELYGGAICYIDNQGNLDSCIAIRMAIIKDGIATVRTGAGIVFDSDPQKEVNETRHKAKGVISAIEMAERGFE